MALGRPTDIPEPGQLVELRQRRFGVTEVHASGLPDERQHRVHATSVEDDALGEEI